MQLPRGGLEPRRRARRQNRETAIQIAIVEWLRVVLPRTWMVVHVPNQGQSRRNRAEAGILTAMGMVAGFPDLMVLSRSTAFNPMDEPPRVWWLEVKAPKGGNEPSQSQVQSDLVALGYWGTVVRSIDDVRAFARTQGWPVREVGWNA
jgi:hypothetical protein